MTTDDDTTTTHRREPAGRPDEAPRLLDRRHLPLVTGLLALVTLAAFENRAFTTILPTIVRDLDGWALFGASTGASIVTFTIALTWAGRWTDRVGPRPVLLWAIAVFVTAQVVSATAPSMGVFVVGRAVSGTGEALIDTALMVLVGQALPEALRARVFATFAAAWILPSLLGPSVAGALDALLGWRGVFLGPLVVAPVAVVLLSPALRASRPGGGAVPGRPGRAPSPGPDAAAERRRVRASLVLAGGLAVATFAAPVLDRAATRPLGLTLVASGLVVVIVSAVLALPAGTARLACGVPTLMAVRLLVAAAFTLVGGVIPLMLVTTQDVTTTVAGVSLTVTGCFWALGSWLCGTTAVLRRLPAAAGRLRAGHALIAVGSLGPVLLALDVVGLVPGMLGWAVAATGMGIVSPDLAAELLALAPASEHGRVSAAGGLASSTGVALQTGLVGAVVAVLGPRADGDAFAALMAVGVFLAGVAALASGRARPCSAPA